MNLLRNNLMRTTMDVLWYLLLFFVLQTAFAYLAYFIGSYVKWFDTTLQLITCSLFSYVLMAIIFVWRKYSTLGKDFLRSRPWMLLMWVCFFGVGTILPLQWLYEQMNLELPQYYKDLFNAIIGSSYGYIVVGIMCPVVEEIVFRGGILGRMLKGFDVNPWIPITISALIFGLIHYNLPQGVHAFIIGMILGWLYYRTGSIVPGVVLHWTNNTVSYLVLKLVPQMSDGKLIDLFHGNNTSMLLGIAFSFMILIPSFFQIVLTLRKKA